MATRLDLLKQTVSVVPATEPDEMDACQECGWPMRTMGITTTDMEVLTCNSCGAVKVICWDV